MLWAVKSSRASALALGRNLGQCRGDPIGRRLDEAGMVVEQPELVDLRRGGADLLPGVLDVLKILPAARIRAERRGDKRQGPLDAVFGHLADGVGQQRMPVAIAPVDRQLRPVGVQFGDQRGQQGTVLAVDRANAVEKLVVPGNFQKPLARDVFAANDVFQKRHHVVRPLGTAEGDQEKSVVRRRGRGKEEGGAELIYCSPFASVT